MPSRRITLRIDKNIEEILRRNRDDGEPDATCISRMIVNADVAISSIEKISLETKNMSLQAERNLDESRRMIGTFLEKIKQPFDQITDRLSDLERLIKEKK